MEWKAQDIGTEDGMKSVVKNFGTYAILFFLLSASGFLKPDSIFSGLVSVRNQRYPWIEQLSLKFVRQTAYYKVYSASPR